MSSLVLCIDFINDIVHPDGKISHSALYVDKYKVLEKANQAIDLARRKDIPIVHVKVGFSANYLECPKQSPLFSSAQKYNALQLGTWGTEFHQDLDVQSEDRILVKHRVSALYATPLATILTANKVDTVLICGVSTNMTIDSTTRELHDRDYSVVVLQDACGAASLDIHEATLANLSRLAKVIEVDEL
jgi:nicotinamidase-related amidase